MVYLFVVLFGAVLLVGFVVFFGPPYLPTRREQIKTALDLLDLKKGQTMLDLGSGDGRVMHAAAKRGIKVVGVELNPLMVIISRIRLRRFKGQVRVIWGNYFSVDWPDTDGIFTFMIQRQMKELDARIKKQNHSVRLASIAFYVPGKKPAKKENGVFLYEYQK